MKAGAGRSHTVVVSDDGRSFAFGLNKHGQLGLGTAKNGMKHLNLFLLCVLFTVLMV